MATKRLCGIRVEGGEQKFWDRIERQPNGCWEIPGSDGRNGRHTFNGKRWLAHRLAWTLTHGPIPDGLLVLHKNECHNPACCNPDHLYLGTQKDNMRDAMEAGTHPCVSGALYSRENAEKARTRMKQAWQDGRMVSVHKGAKRDAEARRKMSEAQKKVAATRARDAEGKFARGD